MYILENSYIRDNAYNYNITHIANEVYVNGISELPIDLKMKIFKGDVVIPVFRLYLLNDDETIRMDISSDFMSGNLSVTYQTGQRRTLSITLQNFNKKYTPSPLTGIIWFGTKFRLDAGVVYKDTVYWEQQGIFCVNDPSSTKEVSNHTIAFSLCDKFGLFSGEIYGRSPLRTIVPTGVPMKQAFHTLLTADRGNGIPWDFQDIYFNNKYAEQVTYYKLDNSAGNAMGEVFTKLAETISSDVYYNTTGHMCVESNVLEFVNNNVPIIYRIEEGDNDLLSVSMSDNWSKMRNKIITKGAITNGYQFSASVENNNPKSPYAIKYCGVVAETIENSSLYADSLCLENSMYELVQRSRGVRTLNLSCSYLPFLDVNKGVLITCPSLDINDENYVIDSYSFSCSNDPKTSISLSNMNEVNIAC